MASGTEAPGFSELSSIFERLLRHRDLPLFLPFILGFTTTASATANTEGENPTNPEEPGQETPQTTGPQQGRLILINPFTRNMMVIEGAADSLDSVLRGLASKNGQPPASKESIEALPSVEIGEGGEDEDGECVICLQEWVLGGVVKELPCKHRFHSDCIEKWLGIHGSCPVCRYEMPVDEKELGQKREEGERRSLGRVFGVSFSVSGNGRHWDSDQTPASNADDVSSPSPGTDH